MEIKQDRDMRAGDLVSGIGVPAGKYLGQESISINGNREECFKIYDPIAKSKFFIPVNRREDLCLLPSRSEILEQLEQFKSQKELMIKTSSEESRFQIFNDILYTGIFKNVFAVTHDLTILKDRKKISPHEKRLLEKSKKIFIKQLAVVLDKSEPLLHLELFDLKDKVFR